MSKKINDIIRLAYEPPEPLEKERFLAGFREAPIGHPEFVLRQFGFIKKRIWFLYSLMFAATLFIGTQAIKNAEEALWWFSAALPFLTIFLVTELSRSISCNMAELEMSCRYSLADIAVARSFIMGLSQLISIGIFAAVFHKTSGISILNTGVYLLTPYLLSLILSMGVLRRAGAREKLYLSVASCCFVSAACLWIKYNCPFVYEVGYISIWNIAFAVLVILTVYEFIILKKKLEDNEWNLSLTA